MMDNDWSKKAREVRSGISEVLYAIYPGAVKSEAAGFDAVALLAAIVRMEWTARHMDGLAESYRIGAEDATEREKVEG
jgi:hypothetical protein